MSDYKTLIKQKLEKLGALEILEQVVDGQEVIAFSIKINDKPFNIAIMHSAMEGMVILQLFTSFHSSYKEPGKDFYQILDKLNLNSVLGHVHFTKTGADYFISYKSNYLSKLSDFKDDSPFDLYLSTSLQMISMYDSELNVL